MSLETAFEELKNKLFTSSRILLIIHAQPDGDAVGSGLALMRWGEKLNKEFKIYCPTLPPSYFEYLKNWEKITNDINIFNEIFDLVIILDSSDLKYAGVEGLLSKLEKKPYIIKIDHHTNSEDYAQLNIVDEKAAATCEILYNFFRYTKSPLDKDIATCLLTGLITDTGNFTNQATTTQSLAIAGNLMLLGAKMRDITDKVIKNKTLGVLKLWGRALARLQRNKRTGFASTIIFQKDLEECGVEDNATEGVANFLNNLKEAKAILVLKEQNNGLIKGSLRTNHPDIDVSKLARLLGGGGHKKAAGFTIRGKIVKTKEGWQII